jgi:hypothetical protein
MGYSYPENPPPATLSAHPMSEFFRERRVVLDTPRPVLLT